MKRIKRIDVASSMLLVVAFASLALAEAPRTDEDAQNAQKRTLADIRNTGTALYSWLTDQVGAAAAGQSQVPPPVDLGDYPAISSADLTTILTPTYMEEVPELDGWGSPYEVYLNVENPLAEKVMAIRSPGRDGWFSDTVYTSTSFDPESLDEDIVWADGFFVRWPQRK